jgi:glycosyltransferase involved in cell wall biosynthesis
MIAFEGSAWLPVAVPSKRNGRQNSSAADARRQRDSLSLSPERSGLKPPLAVSSAGARLEPFAKTRPIRVLMVAARFYPDLGGTETHIYEVTRRMALRGDLDLTILTTDRLGTRSTREEFEGFSVLRCRSYPRNRDYYFAPDVYRQVRHGDYDIIHCQGIHTAVPILAIIAARRRRVPYVVTLHTGGHSSDFRHRIRHAQWRALAPLLRGAAIVVAVSRFEQRLFEEVCSLDATRLRIIQNGGDLPSSVESTEIIPGRIVSTGRLERYKGHQRVIDALPIIQQSIPNATLHILGSGPYERQLRSLINTRGLEKSVTIEYIAPADRERMAVSLRQAAIVTALSEYEAHPVTIMEALTLGIPTVGLDTAGIRDLVEDGLVTGVPRDASPTMIARVLIAALEGHRVSSSAKLPTWDSAAFDLAHVYVDVVEAAPTPLRS